MYLSEATLTKIRSSPTLTFSPSDRCLEAGCIVHQQDSPTNQLIHKYTVYYTYTALNVQITKTLTRNLVTVLMIFRNPLTLGLFHKANVKGQFIRGRTLCGKAG